MNQVRLYWLLLLIGLLACATLPPLPTPLPMVAAIATVPPVSATPRPTHTPDISPTETPLAALLPTSPTSPPVPQWQNPLDRMILDDAQNVFFHQVQPANSGLWQYDPGSFLHPIALVMNEATAFLLDGGRVLAFDLVNAAPPQPLLVPGDFVDDLLVQEPLDLSLVGEKLLVLDRTGDVYALDLATAVWAA